MADLMSKILRTTMREAEALSSVTRVWKFTAGHTGGRGFADDFLRNNRVALGYVYNKGLSYVRNYHDLQKLRDWRNRYLSGNVQRQMWDFLSMKRGNIVALKLKNRVQALGIVVSGELLYDHKPLESKYFRMEQDYPNRKNVRWFTKFTPQLIKGKDFTKSFRYPQDTIHEITERFSKNKVLAWIVWYKRNLATLEEKKLIEQLGTIEKEENKFPKRIQTTKEIADKEYLAIQKVIQYEEEKEHRKIVPVYHLSVGYDLESKGDDGLRCIEVKSRLGSYPVVLTEGELKAARELETRYYLYVLISDDQILRLRDPSKLKRKPLAHVVWQLKNWSAEAECIKV